MKQVNFALKISISLAFVAVVVECHSSQAKSLFIPASELAKRGERYFEEIEEIHTYEHEKDAKTVSVHCTETAMEIDIRADFFGTGVPVGAEHFALLGEIPVAKTCRAFASEDGYYKIVAGLAECGTKLLVTEDALAYSNILVHSPSPPEGPWRTVPATVSVTCFYPRRYSASSKILRPTWTPFLFTQAMDYSLDFSLKLMTDDWLSERTSGIFYLGDVINIEAAVDVTNHPPLRLYVNTCVATIRPEVDSVPKYTFIENQGCLTDALQTGSSSRFLPRVRDDQLQFQLDSFVFFQMDPHPLYITCYLEAAPTEHWAPVDPEKKACSYINGQWRSAEGFDEVCRGCGHARMADREGKIQQDDKETSTQEGWKGKAAVGPFLVLPKGTNTQ